MMIGSLGAAILLIAFALEQFGVISDKSYAYDGANVIGCILLGYYAWAGRLWPFVALEAAWGLIALWYILRRLAGSSQNR